MRKDKKYLHLYKTNDEFVPMYTGKSYYEPWVSYTIENKETNYNRVREYGKENTTFEILSSGTIYWKCYPNTSSARTIEFSRDGGETWSAITSTVAGARIDVTAGETIQFRGKNNEYAVGDYNYNVTKYNTFSGSTAIFKANGNMLSLIDYENMENISGFSSNFTFGCLFASCNGLVDANNLIFPTFLRTGCYCQMFKSANRLMAAPSVLPCTRLSEACYQQMFSDCTNLTQLPNIMATSAPSSSECSGMFKGCTSITALPDDFIKLQNMGEGTCSSMFQNCTSLTKAPNLPSTNVSKYCYSYMFDGCTALTESPDLMAEGINYNTISYCYSGMFRNCKSLRTLPKIALKNFSATQHVGCFEEMFAGCISITSVPGDYLPVAEYGDYRRMFSGCTSLTNVPNLSSRTDTLDYNGMFAGCRSLTGVPANLLPATDLRYAGSNCYSYMFAGCTSLTSAPDLPATTLYSGCYSHMFEGCTSLTAAPALPATGLAGSCYAYMFSGCTSLVNAPDLPAPTLNGYCYSYMFYKCASLKYVKCLATTISATDCTKNWLTGVAAAGTFVKASSTTWPTGDSGIPSGWSVEP